jgi:hypothetical protein
MVARFRLIKAGPELSPGEFLSRDGTVAACTSPKGARPVSQREIRVLVFDIRVFVGYAILWI